ncbi:nicotinate phosphoribosyltransferase [Candidatus Roizmanbacteria bacterium]|nr:nicotinate phosphoribosyltransferase [Candidatus Roizmanbacteria bacterium]
MGQLVFKHFSNVQVKYQLINRSKHIRLFDYISKQELIKEFNQIKKLKINNREYLYLKELKIFSSGYLEFLKKINLPQITVSDNGKDYQIEVEGNWSEAIYWETFVLSTLTERYCSSFIKKQNQSSSYFVKQGRQRLFEKINKLKKYPGIKLADFGTRRRFNFQWQERVLKTFKKELPNQLVGTSNVKLSEKLALKPVGTFAHELYMIFYGINPNIINSHKKVLDIWWVEYGRQLSTALTDNYGSNFFFDNFSKNQAVKWQGLRHDSGDPIEFAEKTISFYKKFKIDPKEKTVVFSDGLNVDLIIKIYRHFKEKIRMIFGWGTDLTNDLGIPVPQIVFKPVEANGQKIVKLTDSIIKATGDRETLIFLNKKLK